MTTASICSAYVSTSSDILADVLKPECNLAIWERAGFPGFDAILAEDLSDIRFSAGLTELSTRLPAELDEAGFSDGLTRDPLAADIRHLAGIYCGILDLEQLEVRLEIVTTDSCRKWHSDYVTARLITTYVGTGTQWLDREDADRVSRGHEPQRVNTMSVADVGIFKGKLATEMPAVHRSPPIAGTGEKRLLLVLNPVEGN